MKKFEFKLEAFLKLKKFNEHKAKIELGEVLKKIRERQDKITELENDIEIAYKSYDGFITHGSSVKNLQLFPMVIESRKEHIGLLEEEIALLQEEYKIKVDNLNKKRGELKVIEKLKEKDFVEYKKEVIKDEMIKLDEIIQTRINRKEVV